MAQKITQLTKHLNQSSAFNSPQKQDERVHDTQQIEKVLLNHLKISNINEIVLQSHDLRFDQVFKIVSLLGLGSFGVVLEVQNLNTQQISALKIISQKNQQVYQVMRNELVVLQELQHPNIIKFRQILFSNDYVFIEMERMNNGTLEQHIDYLKKVENRTMDECTVASIMKNILSGLSVIHEKNYIHRDLKPDNILLNITMFKELQINGTSPTRSITRNKYEAKIADFGLSAEHKINVYAAQDSNMDEKMGTILYMAPEQAQGQNYGKRIDLWACGIIMYKMLTGEHPFYVKGDNEKSYVKRIASEELSCQTPFSQLAQSLFWRLCSRSLQERYSVHQALKHPFITRNLNDSAPLTQGEEVKLVEADATLRRAQSVVLFLAIQKLNEKISHYEHLNLTEDYRQKIEQCNNGLYVANDLTDLYISPQNSETGRGRESELDYINDKSSHFKIEDQSFFANSKQDTSEFSINSKFTTAVTNKKSRHRPPAIQIKKQHINLEPKSAFFKDQQKSLKTIDTVQQLMYQTNSNNTEDSREMSPLTNQSKQIIKVKINKKATIPLEGTAKQGQDLKDFKDSPILQSNTNNYLTPSIQNRRSTSIVKGSIDEFNLSKKAKIGVQSTNSGKIQPQIQEGNIIKLKKTEIQTTSKKNPTLGKAFTLNNIPLGQNQGGLQLQPQSKSSETPNAQANLTRVIQQQQDSKFKPPIATNNLHHKLQRSVIVNSPNGTQDQNMNMPVSTQNDKLVLSTHVRKQSGKLQLSQLNIDDMSHNFNNNTLQTNKQSLAKQIIFEAKQESMKTHMPSHNNKQSQKRSSVSNSQDFSAQQLLFGNENHYVMGSNTNINRNKYPNNNQQQDQQPSLIQSQQQQQQQQLCINPSFNELAMSPSQKRLQKPFIIHQKKITKSTTGALVQGLFSNSNPITPTTGFQQKQQFPTPLISNTHLQYNSQRDLYNHSHHKTTIQNKQQSAQSSNLYSQSSLNKHNNSVQQQFNMQKASLAEQLMHQINQLNSGSSSGNNNQPITGIIGSGNFTSTLMQQQNQFQSTNNNSNFGYRHSINNPNSIQQSFSLFAQQQQQQLLPTINGKRIKP